MPEYYKVNIVKSQLDFTHLTTINGFGELTYVHKHNPICYAIKLWDFK
jgi:hypothetical protein